MPPAYAVEAVGLLCAAAAIALTKTTISTGLRRVARAPAGPALVTAGIGVLGWHVFREHP